MATGKFGFYSPDAGMRNLGNLAMQNGGRKRFRGSAWDAAASSGMAYITGELEKVDPKLREPLTSVTWQRDIVAKTGGGWVEFTSTFDVDYATSGANANSITAPGATTIPVMQVNTSKNMFKVSTWMHAMQVPFIDQAKMKQIGRNLEDLLDKGVKLNYNKTLDLNVYNGFKEAGTTGLLNDPNVVTYTVGNGKAGTATWNTKTADEILHDINNALVDAWAASEYDEDMVNFDLTVPITRAYTQPSVERAAILTLFAAQIGQVKFMYYQPVAYHIGI